MVRLTAAAVLVAGAVTGLGSGTAIAQTTSCDSYSGACVEATKKATPPVQVLPRKTVKRPNVLSVTGGEVVLLATVGGGAVAGGTALVLAGRKRKSAHA